jgi:hypothetical protein
VKSLTFNRYRLFHGQALSVKKLAKNLGAEGKLYPQFIADYITVELEKLAPLLKLQFA